MKRPSVDLSVPNVVGFARTLADIHFILASQADDKKPKFEIIELRLDSHELRENPKAVIQFLKQNRLPVILTPRHKLEGGLTMMYPQVRNRALLSLMKYQCVWGIDVEIKHESELRGAMKQARRLGITIIGSCHDLVETQDYHELTKTVTSAFATETLRADVCKMVTLSRNMDNIHSLARLLESELDRRTGGAVPRRLAIMSIGYLGKEMRPVFAARGSCLNYGYTGEPSDFDQWPAGDLRKAIRLLCTDRFVKTVA